MCLPFCLLCVCACGLCRCELRCNVQVVFTEIALPCVRGILLQLFMWKVSISTTCRYALTFFCLIDLISILPFYVTLCIPSIPDTDFTTALRGFRLIRILKADKVYSGNILKKTFLSISK